MSIKHRAYLFDSEKYESSVKAVLEQCCQTNETGYAEKYIKDNFHKLKSVYTGELLYIEDIERIVHTVNNVFEEKSIYQWMLMEE